MKKQVLFLIESLGGGGAEHVLVNLLRYIDKSKYNITIQTIVDTGVYKEKIQALGCCYKTLVSSKNGLIGYKIRYWLIYKIMPVSFIYKFFIAHNYDVEIAFIEGFCTRILSYSHNKKMAWVHCDLMASAWTLKQGIYKSLEEEKKVYRTYNKVVGVSNTVSNIMRNYYGLKNVVTLYNPIDVEQIKKESQDICPIKVVDGVFTLISIGRLVNDKGYDELIRIVDKLINKDKLKLRCYLLGEGPLRKQLEDMIVDFHLEDKVILTGFLNNPYTLLAKMDLFVCSSKSEGYSLVVAEAMILNIPVVSMNVSGPAELLGCNKYGILCNNYDELYWTIKQIVENPKKLKDLRERNRNSFFEISSTIKRIEQEIDGCIK